jgi:hypothetical protein
MKKLLTTTLALALSWSMAHAGNDPNKADTVIIRVGKTQIIIQTQNAEELKALSEYDLNQMISDLNVSIDSAAGGIDYIRIDDDGRGYEKDTMINGNAPVREQKTVVIQDNYKIVVKGDSVQDADDWEEYNGRRTLGTESDGQMELGINNWMEDGGFPSETNAPYAVRPWGSWYVSVGQINKTSLGGKLFLHWGADLSWYNWKFEDDETRIVKGPDRLEFLPESRDVSSIKSKLTATYINASFVPMLDFGYHKKTITKADGTTAKVTRLNRSGFRIGAGMYAGYRIGSHTKIKYEEDNNTRKDRDNNSYYLNNFRYGVTAKVGFRDFDFFMKYDLNEVFAENRGPRMNALTFGVVL